MAKVSTKHRNIAEKRLLESVNVKKKVAIECIPSILKAAQLIVDTFASGGKVLICGNGGSAADAQHMAGEFVCLLDKAFKRPALPAIALTTNTSVLTAQSNDFGFESIFQRQVEALGIKGDLLIGISTSGSSKNIINALKSARKIKIRTILLTGNNKKANKLADIVIGVPSSNTQYIQESHLTIEHILCEIVEQTLYGH